MIRLNAPSPSGRYPNTAAESASPVPIPCAKTAIRNAARADTSIAVLTPHRNSGSARISTAGTSISGESRDASSICARKPPSTAESGNSRESAAKMSTETANGSAPVRYISRMFP